MHTKAAKWRRAVWGLCRVLEGYLWWSYRTNTAIGVKCPVMLEMKMLTNSALMPLNQS